MNTVHDKRNITNGIVYNQESNICIRLGHAQNRICNMNH